jgi:CelD/BcsL family acetyltransferase involved in cellulose biosynthesis
MNMGTTGTTLELSEQAVDIDPRTDPRWEALMRTRDGSLFGSPPWIRAIADTYGFTMRARIIGTDTVARAGFTYAAVDDPRGQRHVSLPFCDRLDPICGNEQQWCALVGSIADNPPMTLRCLRNPWPQLDPRFVEKGRLAWHETSLDRSPEELLQSLHPSVRRNINNAPRLGVSVEVSSHHDAIEAFYRLHERTRKRKYRLLPQPFAFFERIHEQFGEDCVAVLASHEGEVIGGAVIVIWQDVAYYKFSASNMDRLTARPNESVAFTAMCHAVSRGCRAFDWGVSDLDQPGLVSYKRKFATSEEEVVILRSRTDVASTPAAQQFGASLGVLTELLTREGVPDDVSREAGALLYRYFT